MDHAVLEFVLRHRQPWLTSFMRVVTQLGSLAVLLPLVVVVGLWWAWRRRRGEPVFALIAAAVGSAALADLGKVLTVRRRPPPSVALVHFGTYAFPSGHATQAAAVWLTVAALLAARTTSSRVRSALWTSAVCVVLLVGASRVYLAAHWATDVIGGWLLGAAWAAVVVTITKRRQASSTVG